MSEWEINCDSPLKVAEQIIEKAGLSKPPTDIKACFNIVQAPNFDEAKINGAGYLVEYSNGESEIIVKKDNPITRKRYTYAHELGHWIILYQCKFVRKFDKDELERWCERFASSLLMPYHWMKSFAGLYLSKRVGSIDVIFGGPNYFMVSREAFYNRLNEIYGVVICEKSKSSEKTVINIWPNYLNKKYIQKRLDNFARDNFGEKVWDIIHKDWSSAPREVILDPNNSKDTKKNVIYVTRILK